MDLENYQWEPTACYENSVPLAREMVFNSDIISKTCPFPFGFRQQMQSLTEPNNEAFKNLKKDNLTMKLNKKAAAEQPVDALTEGKGTNDLFPNQSINFQAQNFFGSGNLFSSKIDQRNSLFSEVPAALKPSFGQSASLFGQNSLNSLGFGSPKKVSDLKTNTNESENKLPVTNPNCSKEDAADSDFGGDDGSDEDSEEDFNSSELVEAQKREITYDSLSTKLNSFKPSEEMLAAPPIVTAFAWAVHDGKTGDILWGKHTNDKLEMASLTKMMSLYVAVNLLKKFEIDPETHMVTVSRFAAWIIGTHSGLREGDQVSVKDLFYGMMLPSGNDAAHMIAVCFGSLLLRHSKKNSVSSSATPSPVQEFVKMMNAMAMKIGLKNTVFINAHGLSEKGNRSTVSDLGKLGFIVMQEPLIASIVDKQAYTPNIISRNGTPRTLVWTNTNKLLEEQGFTGIKTGNTPNAGPCLSICYHTQEDSFVITLLNSKSPEHRWTEAMKLAYWSANKIAAVKSHFFERGATTSSKLRTRIIAGLVKY